VSLSSADVAEPATLAAAAEKGFSQLEEALAIYRELGDRRGEAGVLWTIGTGFSYTGDLAASERYLTEAAGVAEESGDLFHASWATYMLAGLRTRNGDTDGAAAHIRRALEMFASVRDSTGMMLCLSEVGYALTGAGDVAAGLRLEAAAAAFESRHGGTYLANIRGLSMRPDPRTFIGDDPALAAAWAEGETLSLEEAVALALADIDAERWRIAR
jgi:hypothetical protein